MKKALVVDDESEARELLRAMLEPLGFDVEEAADGEAGFRKAREINPDIIFMDVDMPEKDGFELCRSIKALEEFKDVPVLMLTGRAVGIRQQVRGLGLGADDYILKPFTSEVLAAKVRVILSRIEMQS